MQELLNGRCDSCYKVRLVYNINLSVYMKNCVNYKLDLSFFFYFLFGQDLLVKE